MGAIPREGLYRCDNRALYAPLGSDTHSVTAAASGHSSLLVPPSWYLPSSSSSSSEVGLLVAIDQHACWLYPLAHQKDCERWSRFLLPGNPCHWRGERAFRWPCCLVRAPYPPYMTDADFRRFRCCTHHNMMIDPAILCTLPLRSMVHVYCCQTH